MKSHMSRTNPMPRTPWGRERLRYKSKLKHKRSHLNNWPYNSVIKGNNVKYFVPIVVEENAFAWMTPLGNRHAGGCCYGNGVVAMVMIDNLVSGR